jgi:nitronate monooxygenase
MLSTEFTRRFGVDHPIVQAGMGHGAGARLAAAVAAAGGLGTIGTVSRTPEQSVQEIDAMRASTDRPFAVNVLTFDWAPFAHDLVEAVIAATPPIITLSFGDPMRYVDQCREAGILTIVQVQHVAGLRAALAGGVDAVVVQGTEAGGHTGQRGTLNFVAQALAEAGGVPIIAAGGIADGRGLAAMLAMGAAGCVMGTRFKATVEFAEDVALKDEIVASNGDNTVFEAINDIAFGLVWPDGVLGRAFRSRFTDEWAGRDDELRDKVASMPRWGFVTELAEAGTTINWAGESSALVDAVIPAAEIVTRTVDEAERLLASASRLVTGSPSG